MSKPKSLLISIFLFTISQFTFAHLPPKATKPNPKTESNQASYRADCASSLAQIDVEVNNVRFRLTTGGDFWWDRNNAKYIVPKPEPGFEDVSSIYAGAIWMGGVDPGNNLKLACQTYGASSGNNEFWPGPLTDQGLVGVDTCTNWDKFFSVSRLSVVQLRANWAQALSEGRSELEADEIPDDIKGWPALGNPFFNDIHGFELPSGNAGFNGLAGFWDEGGIPGIYEPQFGDFPILDLDDCDYTLPPSVPEQMIFYVINDAGGIHANSNGNALQMEIQITAFAFQTTDEINDMTFYKYRTINRAIENVDSTYFAIWTDPDLGCYSDDYIGCDTLRNLAYVYNADALDGESDCTDCGQGIATYCTDIPVLGIDIFKGPKDEFGVELEMSSFTYYDGSTYQPNQAMVDPQEAVEYYRYLSGSWRDGTPFSYGGSGYNPLNTQYSKFSFPSTPNDNNGWSMCNANLGNGDRRTIQAMGSFTLRPGAINEMVTGVVWVPSIEYPCPDLTRFFAADDKAQALFDDCFDNPVGLDFVSDAFDQINIFPNPYYLSSGISSPLNISNLPLNSNVSIFDINGRLLKSYQGDGTMELDLRNDLANLITSGTYIIQIMAEGKGIKAFKLLLL